MYNKAIILLLLLFSAVDLSAQRTAYGEGFVGASAMASGTSVGAEVSGGAYLLQGYWGAGASFVNRAVIENVSGRVVSFPHAELFGQIMWSPYRNRSRSVNVYTGGDVFIGWELLDPFREAGAPIRASLHNAGYDSARFIYGVSLRAEAEVFIYDRTAAVAHLRLPAAFRSNIRILDWEIGIGVRQNF